MWSRGASGALWGRVFALVGSLLVVFAGLRWMVLRAQERESIGNVIARIAECRSIASLDTSAGWVGGSAIGWSELDVKYYDSYYVVPDSAHILLWIESLPLSYERFCGWSRDAEVSGATTRSLGIGQYDRETGALGEAASMALARTRRLPMAAIDECARAVRDQRLGEIGPIVKMLQGGDWAGARHALRRSGRAEVIRTRTIVDDVLLKYRKD